MASILTTLWSVLPLECRNQGQRLLVIQNEIQHNWGWLIWKVLMYLICKVITAPITKVLRRVVRIVLASDQMEIWMRIISASEFTLVQAKWYSVGCDKKSITVQALAQFYSCPLPFKIFYGDVQHYELCIWDFSGSWNVKEPTPQLKQETPVSHSSFSSMDRDGEAT